MASRAPAADAACAMAHEIERLLATPTISPVLLARSVMIVQLCGASRRDVRQVCVSWCEIRRDATADCARNLAGALPAAALPLPRSESRLATTPPGLTSAARSLRPLS